MPTALLCALLLAAPAAGAPAAPPSTYEQAVARLAAERAELAAEYRRASRRAERRAVLARARARLLEALDRDLIPAWFGTPWEFHGTSERPGEGTIACGYFVTTVLRDAGLRVERVRLAQQTSERIVRTLAPASRVRRLKHLSNEQVVARARQLGDGLYVVGLDYHVGLLRLDGPRADFCHSSVLPPRAVVCEPAASSDGMASGLHVLGDALDDARLIDWLLQRPIPTVRRPGPA